MPMPNVWPFNTTNIPKYDRKDWPHWVDIDKDGQDTREEILARDSWNTVERDDNKIISGLWLCIYTGKILTDPSDLDIDHVVALKEAHRFGGYVWDKDKRTELANDPINLIAVDDSSNQSKGYKNSYEGMPPNIAAWDVYLKMREAVIEKYDLVQSRAELNAVAFYRSKWEKHRLWIKMNRVRRFMSKWVPGIF